MKSEKEIEDKMQEVINDPASKLDKTWFNGFLNGLSWVLKESEDE